MNGTRAKGLGAAALLLAAAIAPAARAQAPSEETIAFFRQNCSSCHTIGGGRLAGPDLKGVAGRQQRDWLVRFVMDPKGVIDSGDPYAQSLLKDARGVYMTNVPGMTRERAGKLLDLIDAESLLEKSQFAGTAVSDRPLTADDVATGAALFGGRTPFASGAPACVSCHTAVGLGGFGGGALGPDLSAAYARLEGRKALAAWLSSPPSPVMAPVFRKSPLSAEEVLALVAFLKATAERGETAAKPLALEFLLAGLGGAALVLVLFDFLWRGRFRAMRRPLVDSVCDPSASR